MVIKINDESCIPPSNKSELKPTNTVKRIKLLPKYCKYLEHFSPVNSVNT